MSAFVIKVSWKRICHQISAIVLPLHHLVSHPQRPQPCCHSVLWGFCLLSSSLLHPHSPFSAAFTVTVACAEAQLAQPGLLQPAVLPLCTQRWSWREQKDGCSTLLTAPVLHNQAAEGKALLPSPAVTPVDCSAFRGKLPHPKYWEIMSVPQVHIQEPLQPVTHTLCLGFYDCQSFVL